ncbi:dockerin type I repeat-containing protein [Clostridiaceae bacterium Marseille-Q4145]|nr:dockerin type I repeat-containing protein [Clostridiaceae bacterium Marseille-Q4145]
MKYGRRGFAALLALVLAAGSGLPVSAAEVKVTSDQTKVASGSDITLTLTLDEAVDDVICFDYRVCFDEDSFSLKKSTIGTACENTQVSVKPMTYGLEQKTCYSINFVDTTSGGVTIQSGEICQLTFTAQKDMTEDWQTAFSVEREHFATTDYWDTLKETDDGKVNYEIKTSVVYGDVTGDGKVDVRDAIFTYAYVNRKKTFTEEQLKAADVNGDGKVDIKDAILVYARVNRKINQFPIEKQ